jgi:hypothetical protein
VRASISDRASVVSGGRAERRGGGERPEALEQEASMTSKRRPAKRTVSKGASRAKAATETPTRTGEGVRIAGKLALSTETVRNLRARTGVQAGAVGTRTATCASVTCTGITAIC